MNSVRDTVVVKPRRGLWRPRSLINLSQTEQTSAVMELTKYTKEKQVKKPIGRNTIVTIVLVDAKNLPIISEDGATHSLYCKFRIISFTISQKSSCTKQFITDGANTEHAYLNELPLISIRPKYVPMQKVTGTMQLGSETFKSKSVPATRQPEWRERFELRLSRDFELNVSLWDRGNQKNFMGSCVLDLSTFEKERTHEIWQQLDNGFGLIHLSVTMCGIRSPETLECNAIECYEKKIYRLTNGWKLVGVLHVSVIEAKGLTSKPNAYCILEVDNERVQTHRAGSTTEPKWNKTYMFNVYDVSSTLDLKIYDSSINTNILSESIGKVSIPLLRIQNGEVRWYALKDRCRKGSAKGNCPRILLQMSLVWDPLKATIRLFQPKEVKHIKKPPKFDIALIYSNIKFITNTFIFIEQKHEVLKRLFEWDDVEFSLLTLTGWLIFCNYITMWSALLLLILPFIYFWFCTRHQDNIHTSSSNDGTKKNKEGINVTGKIQDLQTMTLTVTNSIEFIVNHIEKIHNLVTFKVPYLSYVAVIFLLVASLALYLFPFNYLLMAVGIYKFGRKYLNPDRILNNDLLDFFSRIPDNNLLDEWKELSVPEPNQDTLRKLDRSISTSI